MFNLLEIENGESAPFYHQQIMFISATMVMVINMILTITDLLAGRGSRSNWQQQQLIFTAPSIFLRSCSLCQKKIAFNSLGYFSPFTFCSHQCVSAQHLFLYNYFSNFRIKELLSPLCVLFMQKGKKVIQGFFVCVFKVPWLPCVSATYTL